MKKIIIAVLLLTVSTGLLVAQNAQAQTTNASQQYKAAGRYYQVVSYVSQEHAELAASNLDALFLFFNNYFHFDPQALNTPLRARIFATREDYAAYAEKLIDVPEDDYVYLHYTDPLRSELIGYYREDMENQVSLSHQGFIQFLRSFIPHPPLWMREGFAVYFEQTWYDPEFESVTYRENLAWLSTLKEQLENTGMEDLDTENLLTMNIEQAASEIETFYPLSWAMVSFLLHSPVREYNRLLWDAMSSMDPAQNLQQNSTAIADGVFRWVEPGTLTEDFKFYLKTRRTFRDLVQDGVEHYAQNKHEHAEQLFVRALNLQDANYIPYYYLGLINYNRGNYSLAEFYFSTALDLGAEPAVALYALGVNAYADNRNEEAVELLQKTLEADAENYQSRVDELLIRIQEEEEEV